MKKYLKYGLCAIALSSAAALGDTIDINDRIYYPIRYRNTPIGNNNYGSPFSIRKRYIVTEGFLEVQIGDEETNEYYPVMDELRVNERELQEQLIDTGSNIIDSLSKRANRYIDRVKNIFEGLRR